MADTSIQPPGTTTPAAPAATGATTLTSTTASSGAPPPASAVDSAPGVAPAKTDAGAPPSSAASDTAAAAPGEKPGETKPADTPFELKLPDGVQAGEGLEKFKGLAKEFGWKGEQAQKVLELFAEQQKAADVSSRAQLDKMHAGWLESMKADKEIGGADFEANGQLARKAMLRFATPELRTFLNDSGLGNHPELVRLMCRVGKAVAEDSISGSSGAAPGNSDPEKYLRELYPTMFQQKES